MRHIDIEIVSDGNSKDLFLLKILTGEKTRSNETPALTNSMNMDIWVDGTSNLL